MGNLIDAALGLQNEPQPIAQPNIQSIIHAASSMAGVPIDIATRLVKQESSFNPHAKSPAGAMGLTQLMPDTAKTLGVTDPWNPADNAAGGFKYLASLKRQFGNWGTALAAYNWGPENVEAWLQRGGDHDELPSETRAYIAAIAPRHASRLQKMGERVKPNLIDAAIAKTKARNRIDAALDALPKTMPAPTQTPRPKLSSAVNPMDTSGGQTDRNAAPGGNALGAPQNWSALSQIAGHQDLPFILHNAQLRDASSNRDESILQLMRDPNSETFKAFHLYLKNPAQAMDQYGMGSPIQNQWMAKHGKGLEQHFSQFMDAHPVVNAIDSFFTEQFNPMAWAEGGIAGKAAGGLAKGAHAIPGATVKGFGKLDAAQTVAHGAGLGSPLYGLANRGGTEASQWAKGLIASIKLPEHLTREITQHIFGGLTNAEQREVVRLSQGLKPDPQFFKQYVELKKRADLLRNDIKHVTSEQHRVGILDSKNTYDTDRYFPMKNAYDFGDQFDLEQRLRGGGGVSSVTRPKKLDNYDEAAAAKDKDGNPLLDPDFSPANNFAKWRTQRSQSVAFEDGMNRAPSSLRLQRTPATRKALAQGKLSQEYVDPLKVTPDSIIHTPTGGMMRIKTLQSPAIRKSLLAPEAWEFFQKSGGVQKYVAQGGSQLPGEQNSFTGKYIGIMRNMVISNPVFHPMVNIAGNDAAARGVHNLGGPVWEAGGYAYNVAKAVALQVGLLKPEHFIGGAKRYADWLDRALKAGAVAEFGVSSKSTLGGETARVISENGGPFLQRLDKVFTKLGHFNMNRTFGNRGEEAFAVSLFKDAIEKGGLSDYDAGKVVRKALGDYYNFDPHSPMASAFFFMPWLKSNTQFWVNTLLSKPQYVTGTSHAVRNYNITQNDPQLQSQSPPNDFTIAPRGFAPITLPFVGRDLARIAEGATSAASGDVTAALSEGDKMLYSRANPVVHTAHDAVTTLANIYSSDVKGPETDFSLMANPKAPKSVRAKQFAGYLIGNAVPVPLVGYVVRDAIRRGLSSDDLRNALIMAAGLGYTGTTPFPPDIKRRVSAAQKVYRRAFDQYRYDTHDEKALQLAWDRYMRQLKALAVIH